MTLYVRDGKVFVKGYDQLDPSIKDAIRSVIVEAEVVDGALVAPAALAAELGKCIQPASRKALAIERVRATKRTREYPEPLDADAIVRQALLLADRIEERHERIARVLEGYETYDVARDEIARTLDLLRHLDENRAYFRRRVGEITTFLPCNQPLYALACFGIVPAWMAAAVHVRPATAMRGFFPDLLAAIEPPANVAAHYESRAEFIAARKQSDVVIFTGTHHNATAVREHFDPGVLFIVNGSGHNPVVVTATANVERAVESLLRVQLYNQGQDCASPNAILVHRDVCDAVLARLREALAGVRAAPLSRRGVLPRIQQLLVDNARWLRTPGVIRTAEAIVEPAIIERPLSEGGNYTEAFAPIFFVQRYDADVELARYFEDPRYALHAMYVTVFGDSAYVDGLVDKTFAGRPLHDTSTIVRDTDLHAPGVERGTQPYGGFGAGSSYLLVDGTRTVKPTLPQRDIFEVLVAPMLEPDASAVVPVPVCDDRYLDPAVAPVHDGDSHVTALVDGGAYFGALLAAFARATGAGDAIYVMTYQLDPHWVIPGAAESIGELFARKAAAGVDVRVILNGTRTPVNPWRENEKAAAALRLREGLEARVLVDTAGLRLLGSQHQKAVIVRGSDDTRAFASGMDFVPDHFDRCAHADKRWPDGSAWGWHDVGVEVRGAAVERVWATFVERWAAAERGDRRLPRIPACRVRAVTSEHRVQIARSRIVTGAPPVRELCAAYRTAIAAAQRYIYIEDQFLCDHAAEHLGLPLPAAAVSLRDFSMFDAIAERMSAYPSLKVIFVGSGKSDPIDFLPGTRNRKPTPSVRRLLDRLPAARRANVAVWRVEDVTVHSKLLLVDDVYAAIGSANFRSRSFYGIDSELQVAFVDPTSVGELRKVLWAEHLGLLPIEQVLLEDLDRALAVWSPRWGRAPLLPARRRRRLAAVL